MKITGYKAVNYSQLQSKLQQAYSLHRTENTEVSVAQSLGLSTTQTVRNAFKDEMQMVSDAILTKLMKHIGFDGVVVWINGIRLYYIKAK